MNSRESALSAVPTNIITGFLGVGKTSAILNLLKQKPSDERWAVLVNEFGEIGVDGSLFGGEHTENSGVFIREVPGGCMCCAAGVPMQVALNQLLSKAKPNRLLIEPTGLGHPKEVLQVLSSGAFKNTLDLQKIITLVDARKLSDARYTEHETFNQQIAIADTVIGNKQDLYESNDRSKLEAYVANVGLAASNLIFTQNGEFSPSDLLGQTRSIASEKAHHHSHESNLQLSDVPIPECGFVSAKNQGEGFYSVGWRFVSTKVFNHKKLIEFLNGIKAERMKAVFVTDKGLFGYNLTTDALEEKVLDTCKESRIEVISQQPNNDLETPLLGCLNS